MWRVQLQEVSGGNAAAGWCGVKVLTPQSVEKFWRTWRFISLNKMEVNQSSEQKDLQANQNQERCPRSYVKRHKSKRTLMTFSCQLITSAVYSPNTVQLPSFRSHVSSQVFFFFLYSQNKYLQTRNRPSCRIRTYHLAHEYSSRLCNPSLRLRQSR